MATVPRIPQDLLDGFFIQMERSEGNDNPVAAISIPIELSRLAGIPIRTKTSFQLDPVLHELIRIYNAKVQDCQYCQNARQAVAVQAGLNEDMVSALSNFEASALPERIKAALRITSVVSTEATVASTSRWLERNRKKLAAAATTASPTAIGPDLATPSIHDEGTRRTPLRPTGKAAGAPDVCGRLAR